jgi:hypothetical protein
MVFFWFINPFLVLMVLVGNSYQREEGNEDEGGFEEDEEDNEGGKASLTPLWRFVTKLEGGEGRRWNHQICMST